MLVISDVCLQILQKELVLDESKDVYYYYMSM